MWIYDIIWKNSCKNWIHQTHCQEALFFVEMAVPKKWCDEVHPVVQGSQVSLIAVCVRCFSSTSLIEIRAWDYSVIDLFTLYRSEEPPQAGEG